MTTIREKGITTLSVERDVKERIRLLAGDTDIYRFVRIMVDEYAENHPEIPMNTGVGGGSDDISKQIGEMKEEISALKIAITGMTVAAGFVGLKPEQGKQAVLDVDGVHPI